MAEDIMMDLARRPPRKERLDDMLGDIPLEGTMDMSYKQRKAMLAQEILAFVQEYVPLLLLEG
jgi:hypothetical protein